jgi:hypothetical protein
MAFTPSERGNSRKSMTTDGMFGTVVVYFIKNKDR